MAQVGMLALAGVVLNDAIVLIEFIEMTIKEKVRLGEQLAPAGGRTAA